jgi:hypothetical protein
VTGYLRAARSSLVGGTALPGPDTGGGYDDLAFAPDGLSPVQHDNLAAASASIDEITCSTIHGFCQRLIKPGRGGHRSCAGVMDRNQAERLVEMACALAAGPDPATPPGLVRLLVSRPHPDLITQAGDFKSYRKKGKWTETFLGPS